MAEAASVPISRFATLGSRHRVFVNRPVHEGDTVLHQHDFVEIAMIISGKGHHRTIGGLTPLRRGDVFVIHPGQWHAYERCKGLHIFNVCFHPSVLAGELAWVATDTALAPVAASRPAGQDIHTFAVDEAGVLTALGVVDRLRALQAADVAGSRADVIANLLLLLGELARQRARSPGRAPSTAAAHPAVTQAMELLESDLAQDWSLEDLAARLGIDRSHLIRLFRRRTGLTPMHWLARRRGERAAVRLLTSEDPVAQVGRAVGWSDPNYFARRFRALFGMSPREYREQLPCPAAPSPSDGGVSQW